MLSLRNTFYYVVGVVPLQTVLALPLAVIVNQRFLKGRTFFRTAFYFPSVVSSVAISLVFLYLFTGTGAVNQALDVIGIDGPTWFSDSRGLMHLLGNGLGLWDSERPAVGPGRPRRDRPVLWDWFEGPSVALSAIMLQVIWTTAGTFMLMFLAALQDLPSDVEEAAVVDGASKWSVFRYVTVPHLRPTIILVLTLGVIGTWQVFDQMYVMTDGGPAKTTLTPAYPQLPGGVQPAALGPGRRHRVPAVRADPGADQRPAVVPARQGRSGRARRRCASSAVVHDRSSGMSLDAGAQTGYEGSAMVKQAEHAAAVQRAGAAPSSPGQTGARLRAADLLRAALPVPVRRPAGHVVQDEPGRGGATR